MSNVVEKVKDKVEQVLHKDKHHNTTTGTSTHTGPHSTGVANAADPRVDSDRDGSHNLGSAQYGPGSHNTTGAHHTGATSGLTGTTGTTGYGSGTTGYGSGSTNAGPHDSNVANKLDPRVDSDRDGSRNMGSAQHGPGAHNTGAGTGFTGTTGTTGYGSGSTNTGPHDSNLANKLDPRVDSDRDGSRNMGAAQHGPGAHHTGAGTGLTGATGYGSGSTNHGPHDSNMGNKMDPRVDSDRDGSGNMGAAAYGPGAHQNTSGFGSTGVGSGSNNYGPHDSNLANKVDPRVDSDRDGSGNMGAAAYGPGSHQHSGAAGGHTTGLTGSGPAATTAGPHSSNLANKLDPRVDSDRDGSRTVGSGGPVGGNTGY